MFLHQCWSLFFNYRLENCNCFNKETQTQLFSCDFYEFLLDSLTHFIPFPKVQKRSPRSVLSKKCSEKFRKFYRKTPVPESFFNKVVGLKPATLLKKRLWHRCFPVNFVKFLRTPFFTEHRRWLLLKVATGGWCLVFVSLLNEVGGLKACNFIKKGLQHMCFTVNIAKFLRTLVFEELSANGCYCHSV